MDLKGKRFLITGANTGIGRVTAEELARKGAHVYLACRSEEKTRPVLEGILAAGGTAHFLPLDLAELASVRRCGQAYLATGEPLHGLINNAGLAGAGGSTRDGFEMTFGTNHLGHFLLTTLLLPCLRRSAPARIVNVSSIAHFKATGIDWDALRRPQRTTTGLAEYEVSKLCNVLFTKELARGRAGAGVTSYALHPGVVASDVWRRIPWPVRPAIKLFMKSNEEGAATTLHCATAPELAAHDGRYYDDCKERPASPLSDDAALARSLWEKSEAWVQSGAS